MKQIEPKSLYAILSPQRLRFCCALLALERDTNEAFSNNDESCFVLVHQYHYGPFAFFTDYDPAFFKEVLRRYPRLDLCFDLPPGAQPQIARMRGLRPYPEPFQFFAFEGECPAAPIDPHIRLLPETEYELVRHIADPLALQKPGTVVLAWFEAGQVDACLHCAPEFEDIWDACIYQSRHIDLDDDDALYYAYRKTVCEQGGIPQISGATDMSDALAAQKAGFAQCSVRYAFHYKRPKFNP